MRTNPRRYTALSSSLALVLALVPVTGAPGQAPARTPSRQTGPVGPVVKSVDVTVTNIDVVVTDSKGNRVTGLRKEDFDVVEDGLNQNLTNFYAVEAGVLTVVGDEPVAPVAAAPEPAPAPSAPPGTAAGGGVGVQAQKTWIVLFVDNLNLTPFNRNRVLRNVQQWARESVKGNVEAMVVTWDRSLKVRRKFTNDGRDVADVLKQVEEVSANRVQSLSERRDIVRQIDESKSVDEAIGKARSYALSHRNDLDFTIDAMKTTINQLAGVDGRKIMIHVSEGMPQSPGAELWDYIQKKFQTTSTGLQSFEFDKTTAYVGVIQAANAAGVTIYGVDASGLSVDSGVSAENASTSERIDTFVERTNNQSMISLLSEETGGEAILNKNDVTPALKSIERDYTSYYSLGYRSLRSGSDRPHRVEVRVKKKGLTARARRSYVEKSPETRIQEATISALYFPRDENPLGVGLEVGAPVPSDRQNYLVPVRIKVPYSRITLLPDGPKARGRLIFYFIVLDASGKTSDLANLPAIVEVDAAKVESLARRDYVYDVRLLMIPGGQKISLAVRDEITNTVSYVQRAVFVSVLPPEEPKAGS